MKTSNNNSRKLQFFVSYENSELSAEKAIQTTWAVLLAMVSKIIYPGCVNSNFLNLCKATDGVTVISSELFVQIFVLQSLLEVSGKGQV